jgi:hypothetical protein
MVRNIVQPRVHVDVCSWVNERSSSALDLGIVSLAIDKLRHLFHVRNPVDFGI